MQPTAHHVFTASGAQPDEAGNSEGSVKYHNQSRTPNNSSSNEFSKYSFHHLNIAKLCDIRPTQSAGFVADVRLFADTEPISIPATYNDWLTYCRAEFVESYYTDDELRRLAWHVENCLTNPTHIKHAPSNVDFGSAAWFASIPEIEY